uniref:Uncharacterized protein n=1 Tax=Anopheles farauti TaxID=69004 RepID=A0A182QZH6_9DIPT
MEKYFINAASNRLQYDPTTAVIMVVGCGPREAFSEVRNENKKKRRKKTQKPPFTALSGWGRVGKPGGQWSNGQPHADGKIALVPETVIVKRTGQTRTTTTTNTII